MGDRAACLLVHLTLIGRNNFGRRDRPAKVAIEGPPLGQVQNYPAPAVDRLLGLAIARISRFDFSGPQNCFAKFRSLIRPDRDPCQVQLVHPGRAGGRRRGAGVRTDLGAGFWVRQPRLSNGSRLGTRQRARFRRRQRPGAGGGRCPIGRRGQRGSGGYIRSKRGGRAGRWGRDAGSKQGRIVAGHHGRQQHNSQNSQPSHQLARKGQITGAETSRERAHQGQISLGLGNRFRRQGVGRRGTGGTVGMRRLDREHGRDRTWGPQVGRLRRAIAHSRCEGIRRGQSRLCLCRWNPIIGKQRLKGTGFRGPSIRQIGGGRESIERLIIQSRTLHLI